MSPPRIARSGDPFDQALLRAGRNDGPPRGAEDRALVGLGLAAGLAARSGVVARPGALSAARWGGSLKGAAIVLVLGAGAGVLLGPSLRTALARWERELRAGDPFASPVASPVEPRATIAPPGRPAAAEEPWVANGLEQAAPSAPEVTTRASSPAPPVVRRASPARAVVTGDTAGTPPTSASPLSVEIALVQQAARALAGGEAGVALGLLDAYDRQCPRGVLVEEAGALRVQALAQSGRAAEAKALAQKLLDAHPRGVLAARLQAVLDGASDAGRR